MSRQHAAPIFISGSDRPPVSLRQLSFSSGEGAVSEADIQALVHAHPSALPIAEIDPVYAGAIPVCRELNTPAGPIDNLFITPSGLPVLVECKLWRNPEGRREVVGQILDYAKELSRWSSSDLQREVNRRLGRQGNSILELVRAVDPNVDEVTFNDNVTFNLRRGRFLLLIVGDGIREGVEAIAEYLQRHAGLHFSLGLIEMPIFEMPDGGRIVAPRVLARTVTLKREVVAVPEGFVVQDEEQMVTAASVERELDPERSAQGDRQREFWAEFLSGLTLDDPEQPKPNPFRMGYITFSLPAPGGASWLTVYRDQKKREIGLFPSSNKNSVGSYARRVIADDIDAVREEIGGDVVLDTGSDGDPRIWSVRPFDDTPEGRREGFAWLAERVNAYVNALRPRVRSAVADYDNSKL